jgi:ribosomal protein L40E
LICGKCGVTLPEGAQYCLKCGQPLSNDMAPSAVASAGACSCGAALGPAAQFCPQCGKVVTGAASPWHFPIRPKKKRRSPAWLLLFLLLAMVLWVSLSDSPEAGQLKRKINLAHVESVTPEIFFVNSGGFSSYKFQVPAGTREVSINGHFDATGAPDNDVQVYVLTEAELVNWQFGYTPGGFYDSGRVSQGNISVSLPNGPGAYCLVFSNKFAAKQKKIVHAAVTLSYSRWWPSF